MNQTQLTAAVAATTTVKAADELSRTGWQAWSDGLLTDDAAETLQSLVSARKRSIRTKVSLSPGHRPTAARRHPAQRRKSIRRRRMVSMSGMLPARLAASFTQAEVAVLAVIAREIKKQRNNLCEFPIGKISALAGCCETSARNALREARHLGIISITERRRNHRRSLTNLVSVTSALWRSWLRLGSRTEWVQKVSGHVLTRDNPTASPPATTPEATAKPRDQRGRGNLSA